MSGLFVAAAGILSLATLALLLWPLLRGRRPAPPRAAFDARLYRDQLAEVERDAARGLLAPAEAEAARTEVKHRLLAAADAGEEAADASPSGSIKADATAPQPRRWRSVVALTLLLPTIAALLYLELGEPGIPDQPLAQRQMQEMLASGTSAAQAASLEEATRKLEQRLQERPNELPGWFLLGRSYLSLQRFPDAMRAFARARALAPDDPDVVGGYAEAAIEAAGGQIDDTVREALTRLLALDPLSPKARFLLALDRAQQGDLAGAMQGWTDLLALSPPDAPWLPTVREHLGRAGAQAGIDPATLRPSPEVLALAATQAAPGEATPGQTGTAPPGAPGPTAADVAAAGQMAPADRQQMIRSMVDRLAARLQENPEDIDGWRRLARAWEVLGEPEKAAEARARIAALEGR